MKGRKKHHEVEKLLIQTIVEYVSLVELHFSYVIQNNIYSNSIQRRKRKEIYIQKWQLLS